jgi:hypothetical protein
LYKKGYSARAIFNCFKFWQLGGWGGKLKEVEEVPLKSSCCCVAVLLIPYRDYIKKYQ